MCVYVYNDEPSCLIGRVLFAAGVPIEDLQGLDYASNVGIGFSAIYLYQKLPITSAVCDVLAAAQAKQDQHYTWGEALAAAEAKAEQPSRVA